MDDTEKQNRDRLADKILKAIRNKLNDSFCEYFSYAWREKVDEMLTTESRFTKLVEWLDKEIRQKLSLVNMFCPADRIDGYTNQNFQTYSEQIKDIAVMTHCRELLLDSRSTTQMRENIEYTVCKVYGIHYSEFLNAYV